MPHLRTPAPDEKLWYSVFPKQAENTAQLKSVMEFMNEAVPDSSLITFSGSIGSEIRSDHVSFWRILMTTAVKEQVKAHPFVRRWLIAVGILGFSTDRIQVAYAAGSCDEPKCTECYDPTDC